MKPNHVFGVFLLTFSCNISVAGEPDALCSEIIKFANNVKESGSLSVELVTEWGENISKGCLHNKNKAEINFCNYLQNHTSTEFQEINISRALVCIGASPLYSNKSSYKVEHGTGKYSTGEMQGVAEGIEVGIIYSFGIKNELPRLKFSVANTKSNK
ncbi:MAG: hypothetical protein V4732_20860 [Pseudomonadota bacterium]